MQSFVFMFLYIVFIYNSKVVSRANYFWKTGGHPKSEPPNKGHKIFKITKELLKIQYIQSN